MTHKPINILIVEDEAAHSEAIRRAFDRTGTLCVIRIVPTLQKFHEETFLEQPDIALMDLNLPDGRAVNALSNPPEDGKFPILIMTSHGTQEIAVEAMKAGALDYVIKSPDTFADMPHTVERALGQWQLLIKHRLAEEELDKHRNHLEELVRVRTSEVNRKTRLLESINKVLLEAITCETEDELWQTCLRVAEDLTESKFGQIGELNPEGLFDMKAISNPGWDECTMPIEEARASLTNLPLRGIDRATMVDGKSRIVNTETEFQNHPDHVPIPEGHPKLTSFLGVPLKQGSKVIGMIGMGNKDGGYTKEDQENIETLSVSLMQAVNSKRAEDTIRSLNWSLQQQTKRLEEANSELKAFTSTVSHDLRSPLRGISRFSDILLKNYTKCLDSEGVELIKGIIGESSRLSNLINSLLELSRLSQAHVHRLEFNISSMAEDIMHKYIDSEPDRTFNWHIQEGLTVRGDPLLLRQVIQNLIENAVKFTSLKPEAIIEFGQMHTNGEPFFYVKDNGAGFDMQEAEDIFKPFRRLHTSEEFPGTGVGLSTVERIIRRHGGRIWFDSQTEQGTTFYFTLGDGQQ